MTIESLPTGSYVVDPDQTTITFHTWHMFHTGRVSGTFRLRAGRIEIADPITASAASGQIDTGSIDTGNTTRDTMVRRSNLLDSANHPVMVFNSTELGREVRGWVLTGDLEVRGRTAPIQFVLTQAAVNDDTVAISATAAVNRYALGITAGRGLIGRWLRIELHLTATRHPT